MIINDCVKIKKNLGLSKCNIMPGLIKGMIETPTDFKVTTVEDLVDLAFWNTAALADEAERIYLWPKFRTFENVSTEAVYEVTPLDTLAVMPGMYAFRFGIKENLCLHKAMFTHNGSNIRAIFIDHQNNMIGTEGPAGEFMGILLSLLNVEKLLLSDGTISTKTPLYVVVDDNTDIDARGVMFKSDFVNNIYRIHDLKFKQVGVWSATGGVLDIVTECDETPVVGLVVADLVLTKLDGTAQTITTLTPDPSVPGRYTVAGTGLVDGYIASVSAATLSVQPYATSTPGSIDVT